jgi:hypothetical protein
LVPVPVIWQRPGEGDPGDSVCPQNSIAAFPEDLNKLFDELKVFFGIIAKGHCLPLLF